MANADPVFCPLRAFWAFRRPTTPESKENARKGPKTPRKHPLSQSPDYLY